MTHKTHQIGKISYFKNGITQKNPTLDIRIINALDIIKSDEYKDTILKIRASENKSTRQALKRDLGYFTFSGTFKSRNTESLIKHSGIISIDLDDLDVDSEKPETKDPNRVNTIKDQLKNDPYVLAMFISPSGNGLKLLVRINPEFHLGSFLGLEKYFLEKYKLTLDSSGKDTCRACYASWDPELFINDSSKEFTDIVLQEENVDTDTGEIIETRAEDLESMIPKVRKSYERAKQTVERIEEIERDITGDYQTWLNIGMALASFGEPGRNLFHRVSQFHEDYNPRETETKFTNLLSTTKFTSAAVFFKAAQAAGIETRTVKKIEAAYPKDAEEQRKEWTYNCPDNIILTDDQKLLALDDRFLELNGKIHMCRLNYDKKQVTFVESSNYTVNPLFLIKSKDEPKRLFQIKNIYGEQYVIDIPANATKNATTFTDIMEVQGNFLMQLDHKNDFFRLKTKWFKEQKSAKEITTLGWNNEGFYAFCNGIYYDKKFHTIDDYGMISKTQTDENGDDHEHHYFLPAMSEIYKDQDSEYENEKKFIYIKRKTTWLEWSQLFCKVHGENGQVALIYFCAALTRDIIYQIHKSFPHLLGFGPRGTGKSMLGWSLTYLFGKERKPFNLNSGTAPGFYRTFAQFNNAIVWFDEFDNKIDPKRMEDLKNAYDGAGHVKGDWSAGGNSQRTTATPIRSGCYISGQELPISSPALFSRNILLEFVKSEFTQEEKDEAMKLTQMETGGLSHFTTLICDHRDRISEMYEEQYNKSLRAIKTFLRDHKINVLERLVHNNAVLLAVYECLRGVITFPFSHIDFFKVITDKLIAHSQLFSKSEETSQFWDTVQYLLSMRQIREKQDFKISTVSSISVRLNRNENTNITFNSPKEVLYITLSKISGLYLKSMRETGQKGMDKTSLIHYLEHSRAYLGAMNTINFGENRTSGYAFDYKTLMDEGVNLHGFNDSQDNSEDL